MRFYNCKINKYQDTELLSPKELAELGLEVPAAKVEPPKVDKAETTKKP